MRGAIDRWNRALVGWPLLARLQERERALSRRRELVYQDAGKIRVIALKLRPRLMSAAQAVYLRRVASAVAAVQRRVARAYADDPALQRALPLTEPEESFFRAAAAHPHAFAAPVVSRLDTSVALDRPTWRDGMRLFELNSVGIGGMDLVAVSESVVRDLCVPVLRRLAGPMTARLGADNRDQLLAMLRAHASSLGVAKPVIGLVEDRSEPDGTIEYDHFARHFAARGARVVLGDVRELDRDGSRLTVGGKPVDLVYRDVEIQDLFDLDRVSRAREALKVALAGGRAVSALAGDLDHKSLWEVFTDERFARYLAPSERRLLARHALWTRLVYPRRTRDALGRSLDLEREVRRHRERYVLKPNRAYGGRGVTPGVDVAQTAWDRTLERALARPGTWAVQALGEVMTEDFPGVDSHGTARLMRHYVDCGVYRIGDGFGILSRAAMRRVVNVSSGGGLAAMFFA